MPLHKAGGYLIAQRHFNRVDACYYGLLVSWACSWRTVSQLRAPPSVYFTFPVFTHVPGHKHQHITETKFLGHNNGQMYWQFIATKFGKGFKEKTFPENCSRICPTSTVPTVTPRHLKPQQCKKTYSSIHLRRKKLVNTSEVSIVISPLFTPYVNMTSQKEKKKSKIIVAALVFSEMTTKAHIWSFLHPASTGKFSHGCPGSIWPEYEFEKPALVQSHYTQAASPVSLSYTHPNTNISTQTQAQIHTVYTYSCMN